MVQNLDKIISDLKFVNEKLINRLDKIEPVLAKDKYQIEDVDFLKSVDFQVERFESFIEILLPLLETDDEGVLLKKSLIHNFLYSTLLQTKKRFDAIFNDDYQFDDDKLNDYKTRFFELGYCVEFIDNFIDDLRNQRLCFILLFAYFTNNKGLFDFNELVKTANNESDLVKRKKLYLSEYDRVNLLWLKTNNSFKSNIPLNPDEIDETEPYNEEADEEYQATKRYYFEFLDNCQKAIESIDFQLENTLHFKGNEKSMSAESDNTSELETADIEYPENYKLNGGVITFGFYDINEFYRFFISKNSNTEFFLVDKLEILLAYYASIYKKNCDDYWETWKFDPNYFNEFIPGELLSEFNLQLHNHIRPLNNHEINKYLTVSIQQFRTQTPEKRKNVFCEIYHDVYWYPNYMKYTGSTERDNYVLHVWKNYSNHFHLFQEAVQNVYDIFKASLTVGNSHILYNNLSENSGKQNKSAVLKSNLFDNDFFELKKIKSLSHDGQSKLIELIAYSEVPYKIAMFEFLGYFKFFEFEKSMTKTAMFKKIAAIIDCSEQTVKGNYYSLNESSEIDKSRYTAHLHKEKVKTDYNSLK